MISLREERRYRSRVCRDLTKVRCARLARSICGLEVMLVGFTGFASGRLLFIVIVASASGPEVTRGTGWGSAVTGDGEWPPPPGADPSATSQAEPGQQVLTGANGSLRRRRTARGRRDGVGKRGCHAGRSRHDVW